MVWLNETGSQKVTELEHSYLHLGMDDEGLIKVVNDGSGGRNGSGWGFVYDLQAGLGGSSAIKDEDDTHP